MGICIFYLWWLGIRRCNMQMPGGHLLPPVQTLVATLICDHREQMQGIPNSPPTKTEHLSTDKCSVFVYPSHRLGISSDLQSGYHRRRRISLATGCIRFRNDDIQHFVLMICNSYGIDDIQGLRLDFSQTLWHNLIDK